MGITLAQVTEQTHSADPLLTAEDVAERLKVSRAREKLAEEITRLTGQITEDGMPGTSCRTLGKLHQACRDDTRIKRRLLFSLAF